MSRLRRQAEPAVVLPAMAVLVAVLGVGQIAGCDRGAREGARPGSHDQTQWRVTWRETGDSLSVEAIDVLPAAPRPATRRRPPDVAPPPAPGKPTPLPRPLRSVAPSPRDRRVVDATLLTLHDPDGRLVDFRVVEERATAFLDEYGPPQGGPRPLEPPVRSATFPGRREARFLALHSLRFSAPEGGPDATPGPGNEVARFLLPPDRTRAGAPPGVPGDVRDVTLRVRALVDLAPPVPEDFKGLRRVTDPEPGRRPGSLDLGPLGFPDPLDLVDLRRLQAFLEYRRSRPLWLDGPLFALEDGILGHETLWHPTESVYPTEGTSYRIAILGEGFDESAGDQALFMHYSEAFVAGLVAEPPFDSVQETLWIARVRVASKESGISYCSDPDVALDTYFRARGCYVADEPAACHPDADAPGSNVPTYLGVDDTDLWRIREVGRLPFGGKPAHLHVLIANCDAAGGRADPRPECRTAFVTLPPAEAGYAVDSNCHYGTTTLDAAERDADFVALALHESAHVVAGLMDEYVGCLSWDGKPWPNLATREEVDGGTVPWLASGSAAPIHRLGESPCTGKHNWVHDETAAAYDELGAYWGCAYVSEEAVEAGSCGCTWNDQAGRDFFRPQGRCKMRVRRWPFCAVCADTLRRTVLDPPSPEED